MSGAVAQLPAPAGATKAVDPSKVRPTLPVRNCTEAGCHADQMNHKLLHGPTAVGACDVCHQVNDPAAHTYTLKRQGKELCAFCHIDKTGIEGSFIHKPVAQGACTSCHDPHGSEVKPMLRQKSLNAQCLQCHGEVMKGSHAHKPATDSCSLCHQSHSASHAKLLKVAKDKLCVTCHQDVERAIHVAKFPHKPVADGDCYTCHSPHSSNAVAVLRDDPKDLCISCHKPMGELIGSVKHSHAATNDARSCLNCHSPHGSEHAKQLKSCTLDACMACHDKPIRVGKDRTVAAVTELKTDAFFKHGPINKDDCAACHTVHGGSNDHLLIAKYSATFYTEKEPDAAALCAKCHDPKLLAAPLGDKQTAFRDGTRNLHTVHLGQGTGQSRTCRACHTVHASRFPNMIADSVKFGEWTLPLNYIKSPTGGSCAPGCHKAQPYDREVAGRRPEGMPAPIAPPPTSPTAPAPPAAPANAPKVEPANSGPAELPKSPNG